MSTAFVFFPFRLLIFYSFFVEKGCSDDDFFLKTPEEFSEIFGAHDDLPQFLESFNAYFELIQKEFENENFDNDGFPNHSESVEMKVNETFPDGDTADDVSIEVDIVQNNLELTGNSVEDAVEIENVLQNNDQSIESNYVDFTIDNTENRQDEEYDYADNESDFALIEPACLSKRQTLSVESKCLIYNFLYFKIHNFDNEI